MVVIYRAKEKQVHQVSPVVLRWLYHMQQDPSCQKSALGDIIKLVRHRLLVVELLGTVSGSDAGLYDGNPFPILTFEQHLGIFSLRRRANASEVRDKLSNHR